MADLFGVAQKVLEKLGSRAFQEVSLAWGVKSDLKRLERTISILKAVLLDAGEKQANNPALSEWMEQLQDAFNDAEDVLDEFEYEALRKQVVKTYGGASRKVRHFFSSSNPLVLPFKLGHKIKDIRVRFEEIAADKAKFGLTERHEDRHVMHGRRDMTHSYVPPSEVIGRDDDRQNIIHLLMNPEDSKSLSVIPIVGIGGLGKTTLVKSVYNHELVVGHFELRMWACVSEDFDVPRLIKDILKSSSDTIHENLKSSSGTVYENLIIEQLQTILREKLINKKFLLVLDDVWNDNLGKWTELKHLLIGGSHGSMILVTTRNYSVASIMGTVNPPYTLKGLSEEESWSLFVKWAFKEGQDEHPPNLLEIGKEIVKKCKGVPLAVRTLGSLLHSEVDEHQWNSIKDNEIWKIEQKDDDILPALRLSYDQMSSQLKQCFAYCSLFPKDYEFGNIELIPFWMAYGLLGSPYENQELEDVGEVYIKELRSRSFFQDFEEVVLSLLYRFKMHDLVHDLALSVAQSECSLINIGTKIISTKVRHLSFLDNVQEVPTQSNRVRTIMFPIAKVGTFSQSFVDLCILKFKYMRVLNLSDSSFEVLSSSIGTLKHLRSLNLSYNKRIKKLPNSICKLHNLLRLQLVGCEELEELPRDIRNMISLRFLTITTKQTCLLEKGVGSLSSLRNLFIGGCQNLKFLFEGMHHLTNLHSLVILDCESLISLSRNIKHLTALERLIISDCEELTLEDGEDNQDFKSRLRILAIRELPKLVVLPQWLQGSANTLQFLKIDDCTNFTTLPEWLSNLKSLQKLEISECPKLSSLSEGMHHLTTLKELTIEDCGELSKKCKQETGEDWSKIAHVPKLNLS